MTKQEEKDGVRSSNPQKGPQQELAANQPRIREIVERKLFNTQLVVACNKGVERSPALARVLQSSKYTNVQTFESGMNRLKTLKAEELLEQFPQGAHFILIRDPKDDEDSAQVLAETEKILRELSLLNGSTYEVITSIQAGILSTNLGKNFNDFLS